MITSSLLTLIALIASPMSAGSATTAGTEAPFQELTFDQALAAAKKDNKIVMIDFFTVWCAPCKKLDKVTWKDPDVQAWLAKTAVALKLDAEKEFELAKRFKIEAYPTMLFVKADGTEIDRLIGFKEPLDFVQEATSALAGKDAVERVKAKMAGKADKPQGRQQVGKALAQKGKYPEALAEFLWCFDHGVETDASYSGLRTSFLLSDIVVLGSSYPPAIQALEERRDAAEKAIDSGRAGFREGSDFASLNKYLRDTERTLAVYDRLKKEEKLSRELKTALFHHVLDSLMAAQRYADVVEGTGDVESAVKKSIARYDEMQKLMKQNDGDSKDAQAMGVDLMKQHTVEEGAKYYEALLGAQQPKTADSVADLLIAFDGSGTTYVALIEHALRAGADDAARALAERAQKSLSEKDQERVKLAARNIPEKK